MSVTEVSSPRPAGLPPYTFSRSYEDEKDALIETLREWSQSDRSHELDLSSFESIVLIKNSYRTVTRENRASRRIIEGARSGLVSDLVSQSLDPSYVKISQLTDSLVMDGVPWIEFEHLGRDKHGRQFVFRSYKRRLDELKDPEFFILVFSRPMKLVDDGDIERRRNLSELHSLFQQLDEIDRAICYGDTRGKTTKHIAASIGLTTRSVELRRNRIVEHFGFRQAIEIVILLVRLAEHGFIDPIQV
jgi:hypothetical protein